MLEGRARGAKVEGIDTSKMFSLILGFVFVVACLVWAYQLWRGQILGSVIGGAAALKDKKPSAYQTALGRRGAVLLMLCAGMVAFFLCGVAADMFGMAGVGPICTMGGFVFGGSMLAMLGYLVVWASAARKQEKAGK